MRSCDDPEKAVPECFVAENWNEGWMCEVTPPQRGLN